MPFLKRDIYSLLNPSQCYGRQGMEVAVVNSSGHVVIVKAVEGECYGFSCLDYDLVELPFDGSDSEKLPNGKADRSKKGRWNGSPVIAKIEKQTSLF